MSHRPIKTALISVYDKTGIVEFARALATEFGIEIISTGGTARLLMDNGLPVTLVEEITGFPEMLDGRVKTLHPRIFAGILADRDNPDHMRQLAEQGIKPIDMVVVNLYPFAETVADPNCTFEQAIEMIDIGGVALLRAAAKNHEHVLSVCSNAGYDIETNDIRAGLRDSSALLDSAFSTFEMVAVLDNDIARWLDFRAHKGNRSIATLRAIDWGPLRYGENPHQKADLWGTGGEPGVDLTTADSVGSRNFQRECSATNYMDLDAGVRLCGDVWRAFNPTLAEVIGARALSADVSREAESRSQLHCACLIKHTNPCGVGIAGDPVEAFRRAYLGDPVSAMGGMLVCSFPITKNLVAPIMGAFASWGKEAGAGGFFLDGWATARFGQPEGDDNEDVVIDAIRSTKDWGKRTRLFDCGTMAGPVGESEREYRGILGGMLVQDRDLIGLNESDWKVVTRRSPTESEMSDLRLAWLVAKHTKSNAISICKDGMLIGNGAGQMSRVMSCRIAVWLAEENGHKAKLAGSVAASDAFFPFDDGPKLLIDAGVTCIIQPGGSKRDEEVIRACDERDVAMIFTGIRHFRH